MSQPNEEAKTPPAVTQVEEPEPPSGPRTLNIHFMYNGHSWDAYEVLGVPAGSSSEKVDAAYKKALQQVDEASRAFIDKAYKCIQESQSGSK